MKRSNIKLTSYDDIFSIEESCTDERLEKVQNIPLSDLHSFKNHSFKVVNSRKCSLQSERAFAYKMKLEALNHEVIRTDLISSQFWTKFRSDELLANQVDQSQRYVCLTELIPELLKIVDKKQIALNQAVELSYLTKEEQQDFLEVMDMEQTTPYLS